MIKSSYFHSVNAVSEFFFAGESQPAHNFLTETELLLAEYEQSIAAAGCDSQTECLLRFHLSDVSNQMPLLRKMLGKPNRYVAFVGQPPAGGARIGLEAWHWKSPAAYPPAREIQQNTKTLSSVVSLKNYRWQWLRQLESSGTDSESQTMQEFQTLVESLQQSRGNLRDNALRTWLYCRDVDNNYAGLVKARNNIFQQHGLTPVTHYITSTGIEGQAESPSRLVQMDSLSLFGHQPGQIEYLQALDHLSPTHVYGVAFERGTRVIFGDRSHYYISGTASIDRNGQIVHPDDIVGQTRRMVENISCLLNNHKGQLNDLKLAVLYLRDPADLACVRETLTELLPAGLPLLAVRGSVCRPGWLVEMEGIAVNATGGQFQPLC